MQLRANLKTVHHGNVFRFFFFFLGGTGRRWGLGRLGGGFLELKGLNLMSILPFLRNSIYIYMCVYDVSVHVHSCACVRVCVHECKKLGSLFHCTHEAKQRTLHVSSL
jgi:hypothetical protein